METHDRTLLTIVTEAALEATLARELPRLGAHGYTITDARGMGSRGVRTAGWEPSSSIRVEVVCERATAEAIAAWLREHLYADYAMIVFMGDVRVLRPGKF